MTHDELLDILERHQNSYVPEAKDVTSWDALKAVVELHTTFTPEFGGGIDYCWADDRPYPCPTIQAIEKELQ